MQYMLIITGPQSAEAELAQDGPAWQSAMAALGPVTVHGGVLHDAGTATTVRLRDGDVLTTDGPFIEAKEQLTGYLTIDVEDLDAAIAAAATLPSAASGAIEVRPLLEMG